MFGVLLDSTTVNLLASCPVDGNVALCAAILLRRLVYPHDNITTFVAAESWYSFISLQNLLSGSGLVIHMETSSIMSRYRP